MELEGEKKRVKKHSPFLRRVFTIFLERRETPHSIQTRIDTHIVAFFTSARRPRIYVERKKKSAARRRFEKTTTKKTVVVARLSGWSFASTGKARKRREKVLLRLLFFFSSRIFCVFPEVKNTTTRGGDRDKKSPKRSKKRERCATKATKTETDVRAENEKTRKEERSKKRQPKASAKTKSAVVSLESERREDRKKSGPTTKKVLSLGRLFDCFVGTLLSS